MKEVPLDKCKWCNGSGTDSSVSPFCPCPDCEGTGYKYGKQAEKYFDYLIDEKEKELNNK